MKHHLYLTIACCAIAVACSSPIPTRKTLTTEVLMDKIKGAWAAQTIGCTYGGPTEFRYQGTMISPDIEIMWPEHCMEWYFNNRPGLYDDVYLDLSFVNTFDKEGLEAPIQSFANSFAYADFMLWHANQQARYNICHGIDPTSSGYWENNPHADDIDFQIEADYAGIMSPGMPQAAAHYADGIGHIMNYGNGWYGGVYVSCLYSLAFVCDDIETIVCEALKSIPKKSSFYHCIHDVIETYRSHPDDWTICWNMLEEKWSSDIGCPDGVGKPFNIDALINSAYLTIGLLYGEKDFSKTMEIATRCGQDSDCNPASAAGILGAMIGYNGIPEKYMADLKEIEDVNFLYTNISLNDTYRMSFKQAISVISKNGGKVSGDKISIKCQRPKAVRFEESFKGHMPDKSQSLAEGSSTIPIEQTIKFTGIGITVSYKGFKFPLSSEMTEACKPYKIDAYLDGNLIETIDLPVIHQERKPELFFKYNLEYKEHTLNFHCSDTLCPISISGYTVYIPVK